MGILCSIGKHEAVPSRVWNGGFYFSRCRQCECELIRQDRGWRPVPKGYKVVWKPRGEAAFDWSAFQLGGGSSLTDLIQRH